jgi:hypothetical protein
MGRIFFLSAVAFLAYKYIARSNRKHLPAGTSQDVELLPPTSNESATEQERGIAVAPIAESRAVEPDPGRP